jgi:dolichyl-phosphate-mannose--protein O-mannosyl transferase
MMLCTAYVLHNIKERFPEFLAHIFMYNKAITSWRTAANVLVISYLVITAALFVLFYPSISGMPIDKSYLKLVGWLGVRY